TTLIKYIIEILKLNSIVINNNKINLIHYINITDTLLLRNKYFHHLIGYTDYLNPKDKIDNLILPRINSIQITQSVKTIKKYYEYYNQCKFILNTHTLNNYKKSKNKNHFKLINIDDNLYIKETFFKELYTDLI